MKNLNICIDIDGTITSPYHYLPYLNSIYNKKLTEEDFTTVYWAELYGDTLEGMLDKLHELYKDNNLFFVTARNYSLTQITQDWLKKQQLSQIPLYSLGTDNKLHKANELKCDIFIEDHPNNALNLANGGIKVILIDCNYNKGVEHQNITRVSSWKEIKDVIDKL